jgi:hypothetical protein
MENGNEEFGLVTLLMILTLGSTAMAESACHSQATGKNGKPLAGAALNSFMTTCTREACEPKASAKMEDRSQAPQRRV